MKSALIPQNVDCLFFLKNANMQLTTDQELVAVGPYRLNPYGVPFTRFKITDIIAVCNGTGVTVACAGGIYTAISKGGTPVVAAAQSWMGLSATNKMVKATLAAVCDTDVFTLPDAAGRLWLSLTTGSTAAGVADIYVYGYVL
jgi:hypothetical protein